MLSDVTCGKAQESSVSGSDSIISVLISNYPLSNGGYLVSFGQDEPDGSFKNYDPLCSLDFRSTKLGEFLDFNFVFFPKGCFYLNEMSLADFICSLSSGASFFEMKLVPASSQLQGLLLVKVNEASFSKYGKEEEN